MEESCESFVTIPIATMAMTISRMSMTIAGVAMVAIARVVSTVSHTVMAIASMMVTSVPTESSRTYRSIACTEEGSKGTWWQNKGMHKSFLSQPPIGKINPDQEEEQSRPQAWHCSRRLSPLKPCRPVEPTQCQI